MKMIIDIDVPDLTRAITFYCTAFDLRVRRILDNDVAELSGGPALIYLLQKDPATSPTSASADRRRYERHWTPIHIDFVVDDLDRAARRVVEAGAKRETGCICWRRSRCISFSDPFGHGFCLIAFDAETYSDDASLESR